MKRKDERETDHMGGRDRTWLKQKRRNCGEVFNFDTQSINAEVQVKERDSYSVSATVPLASHPTITTLLPLCIILVQCSSCFSPKAGHQYH